MRIYISIIFHALTAVLFVQNNAEAYARKDTLRKESPNYIIIHFHDWTDSTRDNRFNMLSANLNPFNTENNYARLLIIEKNTNDTLNMPCIALTQMYIDEDKNVIVGLSNIQFTNPYNFVIFSFDGRLLFKRWLNVFEAKLNRKQYKEFKGQFPDAFSSLDTTNRIYEENGYYYIDFGNKLKRLQPVAYEYLSDRIQFNHYFPRLTLGTNGMYYNLFNLNDPVVDVLVKGGKPQVLILRREDGVKVEMKIE